MASLTHLVVVVAGGRETWVPSARLITLQPAGRDVLEAQQSQGFTSRNGSCVAPSRTCTHHFCHIPLTQINHKVGEGVRLPVSVQRVREQAGVPGAVSSGTCGSSQPLFFLPLSLVPANEGHTVFPLSTFPQPPSFQMAVARRSDSLGVVVHFWYIPGVNGK